MNTKQQELELMITVNYKKINEDFLDAHDPSELVQTVDILPEKAIEYDDFTDVEP